MTVAFVKKHILVFQLATGVVTLFIALFVGTILYQTLVYDPPFRSKDTRIDIHRLANGEYELEVWRTLAVRDPPKSATVTRYLKHTETGTIVDWGDADREFTKEVEPVHRRLPIGMQMEKGEWCLTIILSYTPELSIRRHRYVTTGVCAHVQ